MALNEKQKLFFKEYLIDSNATQAAIRAGYSKKTAYSQGQRLLKNVEGQRLLQEMMQQRDRELVADQDEVLKYLTEVLRGKSVAHVLARDEIGADRVIQKPPDEKERLKAAELLGKRYSLFTDKVNVDGAIPVVISGDDGLED
jgi:phage terminase small subunit